MSGEELWRFTPGRVDITPVVDALSEVWQVDIVLNGTEVMGIGTPWEENAHLFASICFADFQKKLLTFLSFPVLRQFVFWVNTESYVLQGF